MSNNFVISDDYIRELNVAYWTEEDETKMGIHPLQIKERVLSVLKRDNVTFSEYIQNFWPSGPRIEVILDGEFYGIFDYESNEFESTPDSRLAEFINNQMDL